MFMNHDPHMCWKQEKYLFHQQDTARLLKNRLTCRHQDELSRTGYDKRIKYSPIKPTWDHIAVWLNLFWDHV